MKNKIKFVLGVLITVFTYLPILAEFEGGGDPPTPPEDLGSPASPIDGYLIALIVVAISMVVYFVRKKQSKVA